MPACADEHSYYPVTHDAAHRARMIYYTTTCIYTHGLPISRAWRRIAYPQKEFWDLSYWERMYGNTGQGCIWDTVFLCVSLISTSINTCVPPMIAFYIHECDGVLMPLSTSKRSSNKTALV